MSRLVIDLLGGFAARREAEPMLAFESDKTRALLAFLAVGQVKVHRREALAGLLWPEMPEGRARANLNQACYSLRRTIEGPDPPALFLSTRHTIKLNPDFDLTSDVSTFETRLEACRQHDHDTLSLCDPCRLTLIEAVALHRGPFLDGFSLPGCGAFEEWISSQREYLGRRAIEATRQLVLCHEAVDDLEAALDYARQWARLAPWQEAAHRGVIRLLAVCGRQGEALAYYDVCCKLLREEIGVEPRESTRRLAADVRAGRIRAPATATALHSLDLVSPSPSAPPSRPAYVARAYQSTELHSGLARALAGEGQIIFVAGEAGSGKTTLIRQFAREAHAGHPDLLIVWGHCNAFTGGGDPYLPFRQALELLTGDARHGYELGLLDHAQAQRLWGALPQAVDVLLAHAPDLINTFMSGDALLERMSAAVEGEPSWLLALRRLVGSGAAQPAALNRVQLHERIGVFLRGLCARRPLLLLLDDLQWVDADSVSLLFHLARSLGGLRLMVVGAYRQEEIDIGRDGRIHPMNLLLAECKRRSGTPPLDLDRLSDVERRDFVERLVDSEPNQLDAGFRQALFEHTEGHALFTVETLRELEARGDTLWQEERGWVQRSTLDWGSAPNRVEGAIEARLGRLPKHLQELLAVASVEGDPFSAQTLAAALNRHLRDVVSGLSDALDRVHRLVAEAGTTTAAGIQLDGYRFRHSLFREQVYASLSGAERRLGHGQVAAVLEARHGAQAPAIAPQLARHFDLAGEAERALPYYLEAGDQARQLDALEEALLAYERALTLARTTHDDEQVARIHMRIGLTHHERMQYKQSQASYSQGFRLWSRATTGSLHHPSPTDRPLRVIWGLAPRNEEPTLDFVPNLFSGLVEETPSLAITPDLATSWEIEDEGRTYLFHLRDDLRWSDGEPLTAGDFAFAWQHSWAPFLAGGGPLYELKCGRGLAGGISEDLRQVEVKVVDPYTLMATLPQPDASFLHLLAHPMAAPKPRHLIERCGAAWATVENIVSNGPFRFERWDTADGEKMCFVRNPFYHGPIPGNVARVEAIYLRQPIGSLPMLELYEQDLLDMLIILNWGREPFELARHRHLSDYHQSPLLTTFAFCFDTTRPPFADVRVRRAFVMSCGRQQLLDLYGKRACRSANGGFISPGMPGHSPTIALPYDPDQARQLLAEAGYPQGQGIPKIEVAMFYLPDNEEPFQHLVQQWCHILGVSVSLQVLEWTDYWRRVAEGSPHIMAMNGSGMYGDPDSFMRLSFRTAQALTGWHDPTYERIITVARSISDMSERLQLYRQADRMLINEAVLLPMQYDDFACLVKPWVQQARRSPVVADVPWKEIVLEPR